MSRDRDTNGFALVVGVGNTLRRDDALGPAVAEALAARAMPGVDARAVHQLLPDLAEPLSRARCAVFVDARVRHGDDSTTSDGLRVEPVIAPKANGAGDAAGAFALVHAATPALLLALAETLYGRRPPAWTVSIAADDLGYGEGLSPRVAALVPDAAAAVLRLIDGDG